MDGLIMKREGATIEKSAQLKQLQNEILALQGFRPPSASEWGYTGLGLINAAFPNGAFPVSAVHELISTTNETAAATSGFIAAMLGALMQKGSCLWVSSQRLIFPPALVTFGIVPEQIVFITVTDNKKKLWVIEEALKCGSLAAVVGEVSDLTFTESRRLQLAVEKSHVTGFIHRSSSRPVNNVACVSRWKVQPLAGSTEDNLPGVGFPRWRVELMKIRNGKPGVWDVEWIDTGFRVTGNRPTSVLIPVKKTG